MVNLKSLFENNSVVNRFIESRYSMFSNIESAWDNKLKIDKLLKHYIFNANKNGLSDDDLQALKAIEVQRLDFHLKKTVKSKDVIEAYNDTGKNLIMNISNILLKELDESFRKDNVTRFVEIINKNNISLNAKDRDGANLLLLASKYSALKISIFLLKSGVNIDSTDCFNNTPLIWAVSLPMPSYIYVKTLLFFNASVLLRNLAGITALSMSLNKSNLNISDLLIEFGSAIDSTDNNENTALHRAIISKNRPVIEYLIKSGANLQIPNKNEVTAIRLARGVKEIHDLFFEELKKDIGSDYLSTRNRLR